MNLFANILVYCFTFLSAKATASILMTNSVANSIGYRMGASLRTSLVPNLKRGDSVKVRIRRLDYLGAYVELLEHKTPETNEMITGLVLQYEVDAWNAGNAKTLARGGNSEINLWCSIASWLHLHFKISDIADAFIENIRPSAETTQVDVCLRPPGYSRVLDSRNALVEYMERSVDKSICIGRNRSQPFQITTQIASRFLLN